MKPGQHKGRGGNTKRGDRKKSRYASNLEARDRDLSRRITAAEKAGREAEASALLVRLRKVERLTGASRRVRVLTRKGADHEASR